MWEPFRERVGAVSGAVSETCSASQLCKPRGTVGLLITTRKVSTSKRLGVSEALNNVPMLGYRERRHHLTVHFYNFLGCAQLNNVLARARAAHAHG